MAREKPAAYHELSPRMVLATMAGVMIAMLMAALDNPQAYMRPDGLEKLKAVLADNGLGTDSVMDTIRGAARAGLATSIREIFAIAAALLVVATVMTLFLREVPLRQSNRV